MVHGLSSPDYQVFLSQNITYLRYNGLYINPFTEENYEKDSFLGVRMITRLVKDYGYYKVMGSNMVTLLLEAEEGYDPIQEEG